MGGPFLGPSFFLRRGSGTLCCPSATKNIMTADEILKFWFEDIEHSCWFRKDPVFDRQLEERFGDTLIRVRDGQLDQWHDTPKTWTCSSLV